MDDKKDIISYIASKVILAHQLDNSYKITKECEAKELKDFHEALEFLHNLSPESFDENNFERFRKGELDV